MSLNNLSIAVWLGSSFVSLFLCRDFGGFLALIPFVGILVDFLLGFLPCRVLVDFPVRQRSFPVFGPLICGFILSDRLFLSGIGGSLLLDRKLSSSL